MKIRADRGPYAGWIAQSTGGALSIRLPSCGRSVHGAVITDRMWTLEELRKVGTELPTKAERRRKHKQLVLECERFLAERRGDRAAEKRWRTALARISPQWIRRTR